MLFGLVGGGRFVNVVVTGRAAFTLGCLFVGLVVRLVCWGCFVVVVVLGCLRKLVL